MLVFFRAFCGQGPDFRLEPKSPDNSLNTANYASAKVAQKSREVTKACRDPEGLVTCCVAYCGSWEGSGEALEV